MAVPTLPSTTAALRFSRRSFARLTGEFWNAALDSSCDIATNTVANVPASFPAITSRAANAGSEASLENFTFHGHTSWKKRRQYHFAIKLATGRRTLSETKS